MAERRSDLTDLAHAWLRYQTERSEEDEWAVDHVMDEYSNFEEAWRIIEALCREAATDWEYCNIGAGPIEDLLHFNEADSLCRLRRLVNENPRSIKAVACIWTSKPSIRQLLDALLEKYKQPRL